MHFQNLNRNPICKSAKVSKIEKVSNDYLFDGFVLTIHS